MKSARLSICSRLIVLLTVSTGTWTYADPVPIKQGRLNIGYYLYSINETASPADIEISLNYWAKDLFEIEGKKRNFRITSSESTLYKKMEDMNKDLEQGKIDMIVAPPLLIAKFIDRKLLADGFAGVLADKKPESLYLIGNADKRIGSLKDIRGRLIGLPENDESAVIFLDKLTLKELAKTYSEIASKIRYEKKSSHMVLDVFFAKLDAAVVYGSAYDTMTELNPNIRDKVLILATYTFKSKNFGYFRRGYPLIDEANSTVEHFAASPRGRQILEVYKTPEVDYCRVEDLDDIERYYQEYLQLRTKAGK